MVTLLWLTVGIGVLFAGCGKAQQEETRPVPKVETKTPATTMTRPESTEKETAQVVTTQPAVTAAEKAAPASSSEPTVDGVKASSDWFAWYELREKCRESGTLDDRMKAAFEEKARAFDAGTPAQAINESLELVAVNWKLQEEAPGEGDNAVFLTSCLFRKTGAIKLEPDHDIRLIVRGVPDPAHALKFTREADRKRGYFELTVSAQPLLDAWPEDEYHLSTALSYPVPIIPYKLSVFFTEIERLEDNRFGYVGPYGDRPKLSGWYADLGEE